MKKLRFLFLFLAFSWLWLIFSSANYESSGIKYITKARYLTKWCIPASYEMTYGQRSIGHALACSDMEIYHAELIIATVVCPTYGQRYTKVYTDRNIMLNLGATR